MSTAEVTEKTPTPAMNHGSQLTAENRSVEIGGATLVYRRVRRP
jgi:hypothetical protein